MRAITLPLFMLLSSAGLAGELLGPDVSTSMAAARSSIETAKHLNETAGERLARHRAEDAEKLRIRLAELEERQRRKALQGRLPTVAEELHRANIQDVLLREKTPP